ncbi:MAG TPA: Gfo/Idh/MocA family oxidoreductase [Candidatus Krumholzibacterium sp.]|nr:Gfo/Idh/MocA family oxidoreductase [Candidatus Krumholzibacterium sp.]
MKKTIRWGILGPGRISRKFAAGLQTAEGAEIAAVGSRSLERAERFAAEFNVRSVHGSYISLLEDDSVDAVYIGTPHSFHRVHTVLALRSGRHVLVEKPFAINAAEAAEMIAAAREEKLALMEAMWMRFMPSIREACRLIEAGIIGDVRRVEADFGFRAGFDPKDRLFDPHLGGGALLDVGIYPLSLAHMLLGEPETIGGTAHLGETGVDEESTAILGYPGGIQAVLTMAVNRDTACGASILGTEGSVTIPPAWWRSERILLVEKGRSQRAIDLPFKGNGYTGEAEEFMEVIRGGGTESELMSLDESLSVMRTMDRIRKHWGLRYPMER